jgi:hypothetical protein
MPKKKTVTGKKPTKSPGRTKKNERGELVLDPRKKKFLDNYYNPESDTYANAYRSAINAGFKPSYAKIIMSPAYNNNWVRIENYYEKTSMTPEHIISSAERVALRSPKEENQLKALEFLAKLRGMLVEKKITANVNIEELLNDLDIKEDKSDILDL